MFDTISQHKLEDTVTIDLMLPNGQPATVPQPGTKGETDAERLQMTITVRRLSSTEMQRFVNRTKNRQIAGLKKSKKPGKAAAEVSAESLAQDALDLLVYGVVAWSGFTAAGKPVPCTPEKVRALLSDDSYIWIREQVDSAIDDDELFDLGNSSTS